MPKAKQPETKKAVILRLAKKKTRSLSEIADEANTNTRVVSSILSQARREGMKIPLRA